MYDKLKESLTESINQKLGFEQMLKESGLSRVFKHMEERAVGFITAYRGENTKAENKNLQRKLLAEIMRINKSFGVTKVMGSFIENYGEENEKEQGEATFMVASPDEGDDGRYLESVLFKLGEKYGQEAILVKNYNDEAKMIGTSRTKTSFINYGERRSAGSFRGGKVAEFMTRVGGRPFVFESAEVIEQPETIMGKFAMKLAADQ